MLEDESGRIRLVGGHIKKAQLVTGVIIGALGAETANGDFEVVDICYPGMAPQSLSDQEIFTQEDKMDVDGMRHDATLWSLCVDHDIRLSCKFIHECVDSRRIWP